MALAQRMLGALLLVAACQPTYPQGTPPDRSCIPEWPEACLGPQQTSGGTTGADAGDGFECDPLPELGDEQRSAYGCIPRPEDGECPAPDSACASDALENQWIADCRECLRESVEVACGPNPEVVEACCYRLVITGSGSDACD